MKDIYLYIGYGVERLLTATQKFSAKNVQQDVVYMNALINAAKIDPYLTDNNIDLSGIKKHMMFLIFYRAYQKLQCMEYNPSKLKYIKTDLEICINSIMKQVLKFKKIENSSK